MKLYANLKDLKKNKHGIALSCNRECFDTIKVKDAVNTILFCINYKYYILMVIL